MKSLLNTILAGVLMAILLYLSVSIVHYIYTKFGFGVLFLSLPFTILVAFGILGNLGMFLARKKINIFITVIIGVSVVILGFGISKVIAYNYVEGLIKLSEESIKNGDFEKVSELLTEARMKAVTGGQQKEIDYLFIEELNGRTKSAIEKEDYLNVISLARNTLSKVIYLESKQRIEDKIKEFETLQINKDQNNYSKGLEEFNKGRLVISSDYFEKISLLSPLHEQAQVKLIEMQKILKENCYIKAYYLFNKKVYIFPHCNYEIWNMVTASRYFCNDSEVEERGWQRHDLCPSGPFSSEKYKKEIKGLAGEIFGPLDKCASFDYEKCIQECEEKDPVLRIKCEVCEGMQDACSSYFEALRSLIP